MPPRKWTLLNTLGSLWMSLVPCECDFTVWFLQNCRSLISRLVCTIHSLTMRQENWRQNKSSKDGGTVHLLPPSCITLVPHPTTHTSSHAHLSPSHTSFLTHLPPSHTSLPHTPPFLRRDVNHIYQLLMYARKIFYNIDVAHAVNEEAAKL